MDVVASFQKLIGAFEAKFKHDPRVLALWLEGSYGGDHADEFSDIDIWLDVVDESWAEIWEDIEALLSEFGTAKRLIIKPSVKDHEDRCYEIEGWPPTTHIDINVEKHSRVWWINEGDADPEIKVVFDKNQVIKTKKPDTEQQKESYKTLAKQAYEFYQAYYKSGTIRNLKRQNYLEAVYYYLLVMKQLVTLIRLRYQPTKQDFGLKHIARDVPQDVQAELAELYAFKDLEDVRRNLEKADILIEEYANPRH